MLWNRATWKILLAMLLAASWFVGCQPNRTQEITEQVILQPLRPVEISVGQMATAVVEVMVSKGYHVQAHSVPFDYLIPTRLEVEALEGVDVGQPVYPSGKPYQLQASPDTLSVYDGTFEITLPLHASAVARPGLYTFRGALHYQSCDHRMCFRPMSKPVVISVHILDPTMTNTRIKRKR